MKRLLGLLVVSLSLASPAAAQSAVVIRNVNLRPSASTDATALAKLTTGAHLELLEPEPTNGFLHVKADSGTEGWVWSRNVHTQTNGAPSNGQHIGPANLYPDPSMTPGLAATLSAEDLTKRYTEHCSRSKPSCTYSDSHRYVPDSIRKKVYDEYKVPEARRNRKDGEVDHFMPLCAGGSNDISNLWYQPAVDDWNGKDFGYHTKDQLETHICALIKVGRLDPKDAYDRITKDWVKFYIDEGLEDVN